MNIFSTNNRVAKICLRRFYSILFLLLPVMGFAQLPAFPTAEGAGKFVTGGRGSMATAPKVFVVTTLTDDASSATTPGTFRYACTNNSPSAPNRIIIFRVSGTIRLYATLTLNRANTTIAGQTAPGDGICIADYPVYVGANNMIIRYLRFRLGDKNQAASLGNDDAFGDNGSGRQNIIIDHCSISWSNDEACTFYKGDNVTLQWNIISEPLDRSFHDEGAGVQNHAYGGIWGGKRASFHHNLFAHCRGRMPRFDGIRNIAADTGDFRNNVIYNWGDYNVNGGEGGTYNVVNNYYKYGPSTPNTNTAGVNRRNMLINPYKQSSPVLAYGRYFLSGNYSDNSAAVTANNWLGAAFSSGSLNDTTNSKVTVPFNSAAINMQSAADAYLAVLANAGCKLPRRDTLDQRIVNDVTNRTGKLIDVQGGFVYGTPFSTSQVAWPVLQSGTAATDTDNDGIPDIWETKRGLNPNNAADANGYFSATGFSNLENYINGDTLVATGILNTCVSAKPFSSYNSGKWLNATDTIHSGYMSASYLSAVDSMNMVASIFDNGNFGDFAVSYYTSSSLRYDQYGQPYLNRNISINPAVPAAIISPVTVRFYFTKAEYNALKAADLSINSINDLRIIKVDGSSCLNNFNGPFTIIVPTSAAAYGTYLDGYYLEFITNSFSTFFITSAASSTVLPLQLLSFNASLMNESVNLKWNVTDEINTERYGIERSANANVFIPVGTVKAANRPGQQAYQFNDTDPLKGKSWYRLKLTDKDEKYSYSNIISINNSKGNILKINPNPVTGILKLAHPKAAPGALIQVYSADGKLVLSHKVYESVTETTLQLSALSKRGLSTAVCKCTIKI